jgi:hypothetical protein
VIHEYLGILQCSGSRFQDQGLRVEGSYPVLREDLDILPAPWLRFGSGLRVYGFELRFWGFEFRVLG